jgi:hypothetical protein
MTGKKLRPPATRGIGMLLRKAGHERSERRGSITRGYANYSEGYVLGVAADGAVEVEWRPRTLTDPTDQEAQAHLDKYREVIEAAGYTVTPGASIIRYTVLVTLPKEVA